MEENEKRRNVELAYLSLMLSGKKVSECELASEVLKISRAKGEKSLAMLVQSSIKITVKVLSAVLLSKFFYPFLILQIHCACASSDETFC